MIGFLRGVLMFKTPPQLVVDVNGVGYELEAPMSTCFDLPDIGTEVFLRTHLVVREDQHTLFGFATEQERQMFRDLLRVNGVGAKLALSILSGISVEGFKRCVQQEDKAMLVKLPGVGKKTAERLIIDMRDRIDNQLEAGGTTLSAPGVGAGSHSEAFNALTSLGYKPAEARRMLQDAGGEDMATEDILRNVLRAAASTA